MVWIHGGAYVNGSGSVNVTSLVSLMGGRLVVVSMNYRLGVLGWRRPSPGIPRSIRLFRQLRYSGPARSHDLGQAQHCSVWW